MTRRSKSVSPNPKSPKKLVSALSKTPPQVCRPWKFGAWDEGRTGSQRRITRLILESPRMARNKATMERLNHSHNPFDARNDDMGRRARKMPCWGYLEMKAATTTET